MIIDDELARRIEGALVADVCSFAEGMSAIGAPGAAWIDVAGGAAAFTGAGSFGNRAQGVGLERPVTAADVESVERFYRERGRPAAWEVCPHAHPSLLPLLVGGGHVPAGGFRNVYAHPLDTVPAGSDGVGVEAVGGATWTAWSNVILDGFGYEAAEARRRVETWNRMLLDRPEATLYLARIDGHPVGAANAMVHGPTASLGGTTTLPEHRRRGVQAALLAARLADAARRGCDLAVVTADPGGGSARNAQRAGFTLAYTNVRLARPADLG